MIPYETKKKTCVPPRLSIQQICNGIKGNPTDKVRKKEELQAGRKLWPRICKNAASTRKVAVFLVAKRRIRPLFRGLDKKRRYGTRVRYSSDPRTEGVPKPRRIQWIIHSRGTISLAVFNLIGELSTLGGERATWFEARKDYHHHGYYARLPPDRQPRPSG